MGRDWGPASVFFTLFLCFSHPTLSEEMLQDRNGRDLVGALSTTMCWLYFGLSCAGSVSSTRGSLMTTGVSFLLVLSAVAAGL